MGSSKESLSLFCIKLFFGPSLEWFPFLSVTNITKLEHLHRVGRRATTCWLSSSPIPLLLFGASLLLLQVTLTHFTLSCYERALCLPTSFPILGLARLGVKPRLNRSCWIAFASTQPLMLPSTSLREACLTTLSSLKSAFLHRGVHPFLFMLPLWSPSFSPRCGSRPP